MTGLQQIIDELLAGLAQVRSEERNVALGNSTARLERLIAMQIKEAKP
jgi:hypothetical protein